MFKKLVAPIVVAGALFTVGHSADASEINFEDLANKAQHNSPELVQHPVHAGAYDYNFTREGINYNFYSDGTHFGYEWHNTLVENPTQDHLTPNPNATTNNTVAKQEQAPTQEVVKRNEGVKSYSAPSQSTSSVKLSNGNTPGATGSSVAQEMAKRTGVPASTWEHIIARESNGDPNAHNPSGAHGLLQTMPVHGSTATVSDQVNSAVRAFNAQGLSAWGM